MKNGNIPFLLSPTDGAVSTGGGAGADPVGVLVADASGFYGVNGTPDVVLRRVTSRVDGMFGVVLLKDAGGLLPFCLTVELPWRNNQEGLSCIPAGRYNCALINSLKFGTVYQVLSVPNRTHVLIHYGNTEKDTEGCIVLGQSYSVLDSLVAVVNAVRHGAFDAFMARMKGDPQFLLSVEDVWGGSTAVQS
jgi:hypothetical protein